MKVAEVCEPLFLYMCTLHRCARKGAEINEASVKTEIKSLLRQCKENAKADGKLRRQYENIEVVLLFFIDYMIKEGGYNFSADWKELAYDINELAGDEKFFDLLDETLADPSKDATERLEVFYTCMGLGFSGWYVNQPESVHAKMKDCARRLSVESNPDQFKISDETYQYRDTRSLHRSPLVALMAIWLMVLGLVGVTIGGNFYLYKVSTEKLSQLLVNFAHGENRNLNLETSTFQESLDMTQQEGVNDE